MRAGFENNEDGAGMAYVDDGELMIDKGYTTFEAFYEQYKELEGTRDMLIHFRAASPGTTISDEMCHPFMINDSLEVLDDGTNKYAFAVGHNGRLPWAIGKCGESDTHQFTEQMLTPLLRQNPYFLDYNHGILLLERFIGDINKMVIFRFNRENKKLSIYIINPKVGTGFKQARWVEGVWFSNDSYIKITKAPDYRVGQFSNDYDGHLPGMYSADSATGGAGASGSDKSEAKQTGTQGEGKEDKATKTAVEQQKDKGDEITEYIKSIDFGPDKNGWYWDFKIDCWKNTQTGLTAPNLDTRPKRPRYMLIRESHHKSIADKKKGDMLARLDKIGQWLAKAIEDQKKERESAPGADWPAVKSGAIGTNKDGDKVISIDVHDGGAETAEQKSARFRREGDQMRIDLRILTDDEFERKWGIFPNENWRTAVKEADAAAAAKSVTVPRDAGVLEEDEYDDVEEVLREHFTKKEQKLIFQAATRFWIDEFGVKEVKQTPRIERLKYMMQVLRNALSPNESTYNVLKWVRSGGLVDELSDSKRD